MNTKLLLKNTKTLRRAISVLLTPFVLNAAMPPAQAACVVSSTTATCTGDIDVVDYSDGSVDTVIVEDLSADIDSTTDGIKLEDKQADGTSSSRAGGTAAALQASFDGGTFSLEPAATYYGMHTESEGGDGATGSSADASAGDGGAGGASGGATASMTSGGIVTAADGSKAILVQSEGGAGGEGGEGSSAGTDIGEGGTGGTGGAAGVAGISVDTGSFNLSNTTDGFIAESIGGAGGKGGEGKNTFLAAAHGGEGGKGGSAEGATIVFGNADNNSAVSFEMVASGTGIEALAQSGDGGDAGEAHTEVATNADGKSGGAGGTSGGASVQIEGGSSLGITAAEIGVLVQTSGGSGGAGSEANSDGEATGGDGGAGADGGDASLTLDTSTLTLVTTGTSLSHGIQISAEGGAGGAGGKGDSEVANTAAGGDGGSGGSGGAAELMLDSSSSLTSTTSGDSSHAVVVESHAGDGADGGDSDGEVGSSDGGDGGAGGTGGTVTVDIENGTLVTAGDQSQGLLVRSYGGAGGDGGKATGGIAGSGGSSKAPGPGGSVDITFTGSITTAGSEANGILAQSVGGFAGDAGSSSALVAYGASSESGGAAGAVSVVLGDGSSITTSQEYSTGIDAQSTGGGGGKGSSATGLVALGGDGSAGGDGDAVTVTLGAATIQTSGEQARGISAASIGGGGGNAGASGGAVAIGGQAGTGGDGSDASVASAATITTTGDYADGIYSSSVGGGGGTAHSTSGILSIGGDGGDGGDGMAASVTLDGGSISTGGTDADGVFIQSIGGGGGDGSNTLSVSIGLSVAIGGSAGSGGSGGAVSFSDSQTSDYTIDTAGDFAYGLFAQSVGGGGGNGGYATSISASPLIDFSLGASGGGGNGGDGGTVDVDVAAAIVTSGVNATALFAQSVGGGGGNSGATISSANAAGGSLGISLGGSGGDAGDGNSVSAKASAAIATLGDNSFGILAQSVGGGGGTAGKTVDVSAISGGALTLAVGGQGGEGGSGGDVSLVAEAAVSTQGDNAPAIFGQSVGGGGGNTGATVAGSVFSGAAINLGLGGDGGKGGDGGAVTVQAAADTSTNGANSIAILAQSVGGSGGNSGVSASGSAVDAGDLELTIGGDGGSGGDGGAVSLTFTEDSSVTTTGDNSVGLLAQSVGGSGGVSGYSVAANAGSAGSVDIAVQGSGGDGGSSGDVLLQNSAVIDTAGTYANAILAQSLAGGGGSATAAVAVTGFSVGSVGVAIGGDGGSGGTGGQVTVDSENALTTTGAFANGILAQSMGGDGGNGGLAVDAGVTIGTEASGNASIAVGGDGGDGGTGGGVFIVNNGNITTSDYGSLGIFAQSIGGDGGNGGSAISGTVTVSAGTNVDADFTLGGTGGGGGVGGDVTVMNESDGVIATTGGFSTGILAQSVAGNGGNGGSAYTGILSIGGAEVDVNVGITVGGGGGDGSVGGNVDVENAAKITTTGGSSVGIYAQSIGGNGGNGGTALNILGNFSGQDSEKFSGDLTVAVGGSGGTGNDAGTVAVKNSGKISTQANSTYAIFAQAVGGGGGDGGSADNYTLSAVFSGGSSATDDANKGLTDWDLSMTMGGNGEGAGDGNTVIVTNSGKLETAGSAAYGIYAQSVGGGGGTGGNGKLSFSGLSTNSTQNALLNILESADAAYEAYQDYQNFFTTWSVDIGGSAGAGGDGEDVTVTNSGEIETSGDSGTAIFAQSVGGGGGNGGDGVGGLITEVTLSGDGGGGGDGGDVTVANSSSLMTSGDGAMGIFAHSVGGGGGTAGDIESVFASSFGDLNLGMGIFLAQGDAGDGGNGGEINVTSSSRIKTTGDKAAGIYAQSVGGSGGSAGIDGFAQVTGSAGSGGAIGNGGAITITTTASIETTGENSPGIFAQSVSGNITSYTGGDITISLGGDVIASGSQGRGIVAQSEGFDGLNGAIAITVAEGATVSTTEQGYEAIGLLNGLNNTITNHGTIEKAEGDTVNGYVVITDADGGRLIIDNFGTFSGSVSLDNGQSNVFKNEANAVANLGLEFDLGASSSELLNDGTLSPGGSDNIITTAFTGELVLSSDGIYAVDLDASSASADLIAVSDTATVGGTVNLNVTGVAAPGSTEVTILTADKKVTDTGLILDVPSSAVVTYALAFPNDTDVDVTLVVDYAPAGLNSNQNAVGQHVNSIQSLGGAASLEPVMDALLGAPDVTSLGAIKDQLSPVVYLDAQIASYFSSQQFSDQLLSCPQRADPFRFMREGECGWFEVSGRRLERDNTSDYTGYKENVWGLSSGGQWAVQENVFVGVGISYENSDLDTDSNAGSDGDRFQVGVVLKKLTGATSVSGSLSGGFGRYDVKRSLSLVEPGLTAEQNQTIGFVASHVRVSHDFGDHDWYLRPIADVGLSYLFQDGFTEDGAGGANLKVDDQDEFYVSLMAAAEWGGEIELGEDVLVRPFLRLGITQLVGDTTPSMQASFVGAPVAAESFHISSKLDGTYGDITAGVDVLSIDRFSVAMEGSAQMGDDTTNYGAWLKARLAF